MVKLRGQSVKSQRPPDSGFPKAGPRIHFARAWALFAQASSLQVLQCPSKTIMSISGIPMQVYNILYQRGGGVAAVAADLPFARAPPTPQVQADPNAGL